jgi:hypothetical protein
MIVYGYSLDLKKLPKKVKKEFENMSDKTVTFETGYSVSSYEPNACVLGIVLDTSSFLFNPVALKKCVTKPTTDQINSLETVKLSAEAKDYLSKKKPRVYIFEDTDD